MTFFLKCINSIVSRVTSLTTDFTKLPVLSANPDIEFRKLYKLIAYILRISKVLNMVSNDRSSQNLSFKETTKKIKLV